MVFLLLLECFWIQIHCRMGQWKTGQVLLNNHLSSDPVSCQRMYLRAKAWRELSESKITGKKCWRRQHLISLQDKRMAPPTCGTVQECQKRSSSYSSEQGKEVRPFHRKSASLVWFDNEIWLCQLGYVVISYKLSSSWML